MRIAFRVDASVEIGTGHIMRCLTLAEQFRTLGDEVCFICREANGSLEEEIMKSGFPLFKLPRVSSELKLWMERNWEIDANETKAIINNKVIDLLIVDHYSLDFKWEKCIKKVIPKILVIDDGGKFKKHDCTYFLNPTYNAQLDLALYQKQCDESTVFLLGTEYMILRDEFNSFKVHDFQKEKYTIHVFFGGMDFNNYTLKYCRLILENFKNVNLLVVVGGKYEYINELESLKIFYRDKIEIYQNIKNMSEILNKCDIAIGAPGTTTWERAALGIPSAYITIAPNQKPIIEKLDMKNICLFIGEANRLGNNRFIIKFREFITEPDLLELYSINSRKIVNTHGKENITNIIKAGE